ncbi:MULTISPECIES: bifunctional 2',3'-cyclic-nucleotide 2'-phosphodiesterase/3'-nucleotidase [unclassified Bacillus (in: firmicutes)]|uniref:bifunctional 2',3'-cyclic-nucleotide 2'-phosphodiesterase/3'-nucleotidase n=1 Tax=unclassified Bacillus (in: firmicutes) TaxID=185979 RepID=UPI0008F261D4|nr:MULTISPECIES: bifunctional 2',3'-cyclic-nucleotide 2'-phosphodiesterase/3'-nucleotidase [unclassified Bacillus (in: firmicutes)]SFB25436.1 2',3'-cyclic-nucleotide 2'-phosphodiesterase / 3'-nucleotidase / 5'-nucleotidase [Bacillus sp. UNCCL13]SFQ91748.1 2',3'-cyclic-nucleotide 2'-phosphodiesterase / 3'-nucleotidase / 5'-nucleotidase [Bacillus sp. cl95]
MKRQIRRNIRRKLLNGSLAVTLAAGVVPFSFNSNVAKAEGTPTATLRILETTDLHSNVMPYDYYQDTDKDSKGNNLNYGIAKTATLIQQARSEVKNSMLFDAGDTIQGNPLADYVAKVKPLGKTDTHPMYKAMNYLEYDGGIVGNHEFNYGLDYLNNVLEEVQFPIVNANIYHDDKDGNPDNDKNYFTPYQLIDKELFDEAGNSLGTVKVGVIGFAPPQIMQWDKDNLTGKVIAKDIVKQANKFIPEMKAAGAEVIVAIAHSGCDIKAAGQEEAENAVYDLTKIAGIDAMLFGHAHYAFPGGKEFHEGGKLENPDLPGFDSAKGTINGTHALEAGFWGNNLGVMDLALVKDSNGKWVVDKENSKSVTRPVLPATPAEANIVEGVASEHQGTLDYVRGKIGETTSQMHSFFSRVMDDPTIQIVNNAQTDYVKNWIEVNRPDLKNVPVISAGAPFKAGRQGANDYTRIAKGDLSIKSANDLYLYNNTLKAVELTGAEVKEWLEMSASQFNTIVPEKADAQELINYAFEPFNFDVIDGVKYEIDVTKPARYDFKTGVVADESAHRIINFTDMDGNPIDPTQKFIVATNNYRASGGGNFPGTKGGKATVVVDSPFENRQILMDYIKAKGVVNPAADNNWKIAPVGGVAKTLTFKSSPAAKEYLTSAPNVKNVGPLPDGSGFEQYTLDQNVHVQLLGINDYHGQLDTYRLIKDSSGNVVDKSGGIEYLAAYLKKSEETNPANTLMLHAGDAVGASAPVSALLQDEPTIRFLNEIGFDAGTIGNHEFDEGVAEMLRLINGGEHAATVEKYGAFEGADFPYVAANVQYKDSKELILDPYTIKEVDGVKIGIIGVVTKSTPSIVIPSAVANVEFTDEVTAINKYTAELKEKGVKTIVVLTHNPGTSKTDGTGATGEVVEFASKVDPEVDVMYGAHDHKYLNTDVNGIRVVQSWSYGTAFSDIDLTIDPVTGDVVKDQTKAAVVDTLHSGITPDAKIAAEMKEYKDAVAPKLNKVIGTSEVALTRTPNASGEQVLGNIIADSMRAEMDTDMAFMNPGGIRNDLEAGELTWGELFGVQPFGNDLIKMTVTGEVLRELLNQQWTDVTRAKMLQISGLVYTWKEKEVVYEKDGKTYKIGEVLDLYTEDGEEIAAEDTFTITVNNFMAGGGDGYAALLKGTNKLQGPTDLDAFVKYIQNYDGPINADYENRFLKADDSIVDTEVFFLNNFTEVLEGTTDPYATVVVSVDGEVIGEGYADNYGNFAVDMEKQAAGTIVEVETTDLFGNSATFEFEVEKLATGWQQFDGHWYYVDPKTGEPVTGWFKVKGKWYLFDEEGIMQTGWKKHGNKWYYLNADGDMAIGWIKVGGKWYFLAENGEMKTGWVKSAGKWYFLDDKGVMKTGWVQSKGKWFFLEANGAMKTGWVQSGGKWYFLDYNTGAMKTGWLQLGKKWYYLDDKGAMKTGWVQVGKKWYYFYKDGTMASNTKIDGYKLGKDGAWIK